MGGLCNWVSDFAIGFIGLAILAIVLGVIIPLFTKKEPPKAKRVQGLDGTVLEGLAKVLQALKDLPPWVAIYLAGLALIWTATSAPGLCTV